MNLVSKYSAPYIERGKQPAVSMARLYLQQADASLCIMSVIMRSIITFSCPQHQSQIGSFAHFIVDIEAFVCPTPGDIDEVLEVVNQNEILELVDVRLLYTALLKYAKHDTFDKVLHQSSSRKRGIPSVTERCRTSLCVGVVENIRSGELDATYINCISMPLSTETSF